MKRACRCGKWALVTVGGKGKRRRRTRAYCRRTRPLCKLMRKKVGAVCRCSGGLAAYTLKCADSAPPHRNGSKGCDHNPKGAEHIWEELTRPRRLGKAA